MAEFKTITSTGKGADYSKAVFDSKFNCVNELNKGGYSVDVGDLVNIGEKVFLLDTGETSVEITWQVEVEKIGESSQTTTTENNSINIEVTGYSFYRADPNEARQEAIDDYKKQLESNGSVDYNTLKTDEKRTEDENGFYSYEIKASAKVTRLSDIETTSKESIGNNSETGTLTFIEIYIVPDEEIKIPDTPQDTNKKTEDESTKNEQQQQISDVTKSNPEVTIDNTPSELKPQGREKLAIVLNKKRSELKRVLIPLVINLATGLGIKYLSGKVNESLDSINTCPPPDVLKSLSDKRNEIVSWLNKVTKTIDTLSKILTGAGLLLNIINITLKTVKTARRTASAAAKTIPNPIIPALPGAVVTGLNDLKDYEEVTEYYLNKISGAVLSLGLSLTLINQVLLGIMNLLESIDNKLLQCGQDSTQLLPLSPTLLELRRIEAQTQQNDNYETSYNGFILEIVEEPYTPTVNRRKAVAKNSQNIILLETPLSFTTNNQVLIDLIKLLIDENNLKAY